MAKGVKLTDMVRAAMADLGGDAKPLAIQGFIKEKYGKEVSTTIISNYKSVMKKKAGAGGTRGPGRPKKDGAAGPGRPKASANGSIQIQDLDAIRGLVERLGAESVRKLLDYVGK